MHWRPVAGGHVACCKIEIGLEIFARNSNFNFQLTRRTLEVRVRKWKIVSLGAELEPEPEPAMMGMAVVRCWLK